MLNLVLLKLYYELIKIYSANCFLKIDIYDKIELVAFYVCRWWDEIILLKNGQIMNFIEKW
jgi:hypothetical protein